MHRPSGIGVTSLLSCVCEHVVRGLTADLPSVYAQEIDDANTELAVANQKQEIEQLTAMYVPNLIGVLRLSYLFVSDYFVRNLQQQKEIISADLHVGFTSQGTVVLFHVNILCQSPFLPKSITFLTLTPVALKKTNKQIYLSIYLSTGICIYNTRTRMRAHTYTRMAESPLRIHTIHHSIDSYGNSGCT